MAGCVVPDKYDEFIRVLFLQFGEKYMCRHTIKTINTREVKAVSREWRHRREEISVIKGLLTVDNGALTDFRPASPEVRYESIAHLVSKIEGVWFSYLLHERGEAPFLNVSCRSLFPCTGCGRAPLYE